MNRSPVIGITTDYKEKENTYSKYPWFALRRHYSDCLYKFGCTPIVLPLTETIENIDFFLARAQKILIFRGLGTENNDSRGPEKENIDF